MGRKIVPWFPDDLIPIAIVYETRMHSLPRIFGGGVRGAPVGFIPFFLHKLFPGIQPFP